MHSIKSCYAGAALCLLMLADGGAALAAIPSVGERLSFVACPMVRNTFVPAWLAEYEGELYYLGPQGDLGANFYPPQLNHRALIEGVVSGGDRISGGIVLSPVEVSVLPELDVACNTILPAGGFADPPHHRTPGPTNTEEEEERRPAYVPNSLTEPGTFDVPFAFNVGDHLFARYSRAVSQAASFARESGAKEVQITGYRSAAVLSSGERLIERDNIAEQRVAMIAKMLAHAGVSEALIKTETRDVTDEANGVDDHLLRRATIVVRP